MAVIKHYKTLKELNKTDYDKIDALIKRTFYVLPSEYVEDFINNSKKASMVCLQEDNGDYSGFAFITEVTEHGIINLNLLHVEEEHRRKGYATQILAYLDKYARENKVTKTNLVVSLDNEPARVLYEKMGYIYEGKSKCQTVSLMIKYTSKATNYLAGVSYEMLKQYGSEYYTMIIPTYYTQKYDKFYPYVKGVKSPDELLDAVITSEEMLNAGVFWKEMALNDDDINIATTIKYKIRNNLPIDQDVLDSYPITLSLPKEELIKACDVIECMSSLFIQDTFLYNEAANINSENFKPITADYIDGEERKIREIKSEINSPLYYEIPNSDDGGME